MKKALLILLALTMVMSMMVVAPISASAAEEIAVGSVAADYKPEGTAVATAEEFAAMAADGKYYLSADITLTQSYENSFTGTFDGNGHTINTTATLFINLDGTVKNLTVTGAVEDSALHDPKKFSGVVSRYAAFNADTVIENVCNQASMTSQYNGMGSMVGYGGNNSGNTLTVKNCANYGALTTFFSASANYDSGAIVGYFEGTTNSATIELFIDGCVNYGTVNAYGRPGGILGYSQSSASLKNCENNGKIQAIDNYCGGIAGRLGGTNAAAVFVVENCVNNGTVNYNGAKTAQLGGMVGYLSASKTVTFKNCTNNGDLSATDSGANIQAGGMVGGGEDKNITTTKGTITFENCVNNGSLNVTAWQKDGYAGGLVGRNYSHMNTIAKNCVNNGDIIVTASGSTNRVAGMFGYVKYDVTMENCINNGDIASNRHAAGMIGYADDKGTHSLNITSCGNTGNITSKDQAGGLIAYMKAGNTRGPAITYSFNAGNVVGQGWAGGLIAYLNAGTGKVSYSYVGGSVSNPTPATTVASGDAVKAKTQYTFNVGGTDYYFYVPMDGVVTISGTTVTVDTFTALLTGAATANNGDTAAKQTFYSFAGGYFVTETAGAIAIDGTNVTVGGKAVDVFSGEIPVFTHRINSWAVLWDNNRSMDIDTATIYIEDGAAGIDYSMGSSNKWCLIGGISDSMTKYDAADFASGKIAYMLNTAAGKNVFYQNLLSAIFVVDAYPTTDSTHAVVMESSGSYTNQLFEINPDVTPSTGDATVYVVVALGVSALALAGLAISKKRKVRN